MTEHDAIELEESPREEPSQKASSGAASTLPPLVLPHDRSSWKQWLLASLVAGSICWVMLWTTLATHTAVTRETIYPALESKYFDHHSGARVFTYLGVFYISLGTVSYTALMAGIRMPKPSPRLVRMFHAPIPFTTCELTALEAGASVIFCTLLVTTFFARVLNRFEFGYWPSERYVYEVAKTFGKSIALILMVLLFPVSKSCFWWDLFNFHFERVLKFHRWLAWLMVWVVFVHASTAIASLLMVNQFKACMWPNDECEKPGGWGNWDGLETSRILTYGWVTILLGTPIVITSIAWVRRNHFELFYYTHLLFVPFFITVHLHYNNMVYYMAPGLAAYTLDKVVWFYVTRRPTKIANLSSPAPDFVRIVVALKQGHNYEPGAWVQTKIPAISTFEWHPMSVVSAPGHSTITIDVKVLGDWTAKLAKLAARFDASRPSHTCIFIDKFHGSSHTEMQGYLSHAAVLMFAGGIGITPMMSAIQHIVEESARYSHIRRTVLVWCCKKMSCVDLYRDKLTRYQALKSTPSGCEIEVIIHVTFSEKESGEVGEMAAIDVNQASLTSHKRKLSTGCEQRPFAPCIMGYGKKLILTAAAGVGCLLGIFAANVIVYEQEWRPEVVSLLQLAMAVTCTGGLVASVLVSSSCVQYHRRLVKEEEEQNTNETTTIGSSIREDRGDDGGFEGLSIVSNCRPDVANIMGEMQSYCQNNDINTLGVSVCGPAMLVQSVNENAKRLSSRGLQFIVDEETFDW